MNTKRVKVVVIADSNYERQKFFNLFLLMLEGRVEKATSSISEKRIYTDKFEVLFIPKDSQIRGMRSHYTINLTQDTDFHEVVKHMNRPFDSLREEEKWSDLFFNLNK